MTVLCRELVLPWNSINKFLDYKDLIKINMFLKTAFNIGVQRLSQIFVRIEIYGNV